MIRPILLAALAAFALPLAAQTPAQLPDPAEQTAIVRYLDYVNQRVKRYVRAKERLVKLLEEQKQAMWAMADYMKLRRYAPSSYKHYGHRFKKLLEAYPDEHPDDITGVVVSMDKLEAGIELRGTEVKSIRQGHVRIDEAYVDVDDDQAELLQMTIQPYDHGNINNHTPTRARRLLLHKKEILRLQSKANEKGLTIIPLKVYLKRGIIKVEIALCKGKDHIDKRETLKKRTADLDARRAIAARRN